MNRTKPYLVLPLFFMLVACGGGSGGKTITSPDEIVNVAANDQQLVGYWSSEDSANPSFEFFASPTEAPFNVSLQTGKLFEAGKLVSLFSWRMQTSGVVNLNLVSPSCLQRPLTSCPTLQSIAIDAKGSSIYDSTWTIQYDQNLDGISDKRITGRYRYKEIDATQFSSGDLFLSHSNNRIFDSPIPGSVSNGALSIRLDDFKKPITLTAASYTANKYRINFQATESQSIEDTEEFSTPSGYKNFTVKEWYENVSLSATANNEYTLSYDLHRKVNSPTGIDSARLTDYEKVEKKSTIVVLINKFQNDFMVPVAKQLYINMEVKFPQFNAGNELMFTSNTEGTLSYTLPFDTTSTNTRKFTWAKTADGSLTLNFPNLGEVKMRTLQKINGGYQMLYSVPDKNYGTTYKIRDLIYDDISVVDESTLPGRYKFTSVSPLPNGSHEYEATFHKDKRVTGVVGGYWFQDFNGDIVSYECTNLLGQVVVHYDECVKAFDNLSLFKFAHIRRLKFVSKNGNEYQVKYTGSQYTGGTYEWEYFYSNFPLTYRWTRIGDEPINN